MSAETAPGLTWGLIGTGDLAGKRVAAALQQAAGSRLVAVHGRDPERARAFADRHGVARACATVEEMIGLVDAVYVCTPPETHSAYALAALRAGRHVLVEKPMAVSTAECTSMIAAARAARVRLGVAYYRRAWPKMRRVKELIDGGVLGTPTWVGITAHGWYAPGPEDPKGWRVDPNRSGGAGALADIGVHRFDLIDYWLGQPRLRYRHLQHLVHGYAAEDGASIMLELTNGAPVHAYLAWNSRIWSDRLELVGSDAKLVLDPLDSAVLTVIRGREREELCFEPPANAHLPCVQDFVDAVREDREPLCDGEAGQRTTQVLETVVRAPEPSDSARPVLFTACPFDGLDDVIATYFDRCQRRCPEIEGCAAKWTREDLVPGLSDVDTRLLVAEGTSVDDWCRISAEVGRAHLELCRERKEWARTLEHLPGVNLRWDELLDPAGYYPEFSQWTYYRGPAPRLAQVRRHLDGSSWGREDELFHWKKIAGYLGRYNRTIDPAINLGAYASKYPLHSRLMHYFTPAVHAGVCLMRRRSSPGKLEALRAARDLLPDPATIDLALELVERHYEAPEWLVEPAITRLDERLEAYLAGMAAVLGSRHPWLALPPSPTASDLRARLKAHEPAPSFVAIFETMKFARLMKGRLWFYAHDVPWFDSRLLIVNELSRIRRNFLEQPMRMFVRLTRGIEVDAAQALDLVSREGLDAADVAACRRFAELADPRCPTAELRPRAAAIAECFDPFYRAIDRLLASASVR
jgi:predicted dehydrogenase